MIIVLLLILPLLSSLLLFSKRTGKYSKNFALAASLVTFALSLVAGYAFAFANDKILALDLDLKQLLDINKLQNSFIVSGVCLATEKAPAKIKTNKI